MNRRDFLRWGGMVGAAGLLASYAVFIERYLILTNHYLVSVPNLPQAFSGLRVVQLTDLHYGSLVPLAVIRYVINRANSLRHDLIVCTGDYLHERAATTQIDTVWPLLAGLEAPLGAQLVLGNHDHWPTHRDQFGVPLTTTDGAALAHYDAAVAKLLTFNNDPVAEVDRATAIDPGLVMCHVLKGLLCVLGTEKSLLPEARAALAAGRSVAGGASARELRHLDALGRWIDGRLHDACAAWEQILVDQADDGLAMIAAHQGDFFLGQSSELRDRVARRLGSIEAGSRLEGYYLGMHAFGLEETGDYAAAEDAGRRALDRDRRDAWAVHAVAHVMEMTNRVDDGREWLESRTDDWSGRAKAFHSYASGVCHQ